MNLKLHLPNRTVPVEALVENGRLTITDTNGIWFQLEGLTADHILHSGEPGLIHGETQPSQRCFVTSDLTLTDLDPALGPATLKAMLIEHFSLIGMPEIVEALMLDYKAETGRAYQPNKANDGDPQLASDLARVTVIEDDLLDDEGKLIWGAQSRIAEALGVANGGAYRSRILAVARSLERKAA